MPPPRQGGRDRSGRAAVLACDAAVAPAQRVTSARQVKLIGGGGTDMGAGIAAASALRPRPAIAVVLTDGDTPWPQVAPKGHGRRHGQLKGAVCWSAAQDDVLVAMDETAPREESGPAAQAAGAPAADPDDAHSDAKQDSGAKPDSPGKQDSRTQPASTAQPDSGADSARKKDSGATPAASSVLTTAAVLLTIGSAATDVISFTRLGSVFASVMTSNIVFLGLAAANQSAALAGHAAVSFAGYVIGVAGGSRMARSGCRNGDAAPGHGGKPWSAWITATLITEAAIFAVFAAGWEITGTKPSGAAQFFLLAVATVAMGMQSAVVIVLGIAGVSTTYLTGTLTTLIDTIARPDRRGGADARRVLVLLALVAGAGLSGLLIATVPSAVPAIPLAMLMGVVVIGTGLVRVDRRNR